MKNKIITGVLFMAGPIAMLYFYLDSMPPIEQVVASFSTEMQSEEYNESNNGKTIRVLGSLESKGENKDELFGVSTNDPILYRQLLVYQWKEYSHKSNKKTTYSYRGEWLPEIIETRNYRETKESVDLDPEIFKLNKVWAPKKLAFGKYTVAKKALNQNHEAYEYCKNINETGSISQAKGFTKVSPIVWYKGESSLNEPTIGDQKIVFKSIPVTKTIQVMGIQQNDKLISGPAKKLQLLNEDSRQVSELKTGAYSFVAICAFSLVFVIIGLFTILRTFKNRKHSRIGEDNIGGKSNVVRTQSSSNAAEKIEKVELKTFSAFTEWYNKEDNTYQTQVADSLNSLKEAQGEFKAKRKKLWPMTFGASLIPSVLVLFLSPYSIGPNIIIAIVALLVFGLIIQKVVYGKENKNYMEALTGISNAYKQNVVGGMVAFLGGKFTLKPSASITLEQIEEANIYKTKNSYKHTGQDLFQGIFDGTKMEFSEVQYYYTTGSKNRKRTVNIFKGIFIVVELDRRIAGETIILPEYRQDFGVFEKKTNKPSKSSKYSSDVGELVLFDNEDFESKYVVYSTSVNDARNIVTKEFQNTIVETHRNLSDGICISIKDNKMCIAYPESKNMFEVTDIRKIGFKDVEINIDEHMEDYEILSSILLFTKRLSSVF